MKKQLCLFSVFLMLLASQIKITQESETSFNMKNFSKFLKEIKPHQPIQETQAKLSAIQKEDEDIDESIKKSNSRREGNRRNSTTRHNKQSPEAKLPNFEIVKLRRHSIPSKGYKNKISSRKTTKNQESNRLKDSYYNRFRFSNTQENESENSQETSSELNSLSSTAALNSATFSSYAMTTSLPPIHSNWLTITSDFFKNNNSLPNLNTVEGPKKFNVDDKDRLMNATFRPTKETQTLKLSKLHFYARINEKYIYFTPNPQEFVNILSIPLKNYKSSKNLYNSENCFEITFLAMKENKDSKFTFCSASQDDTTKWVCLIERLAGGKDYKACLDKLALNLALNQPRIVKRQIKQPFMVIPQPQRMCNQGWDYLQKGANWECICLDGKEQSPIDLPPKKMAVVTPERPLFEYDIVNGSATLRMLNENEALRIKANTAELLSARGFGKLVTRDGTVYYAMEITFHTPSEHTINGKRFPLEIQVLHEAKSKGDFGKKAILSVLFDGKPGVYNRFLDDVEFFSLPNPSDGSRRLHNKLFVPNLLITADEPQTSIVQPFSFYTYQGSLTQPPCVENVVHYVVAEPIPASVTALDMFKEALRFPDFEDQNGNIVTAKEKPLYNARDTQPLNGRSVFLYDADLFAKPIFSESDAAEEKYSRRKDGHYEKQLVEVTDYVYVDTMEPSEVPGAVVVSEEEAK